MDTLPQLWFSLSIDLPFLDSHYIQMQHHIQLSFLVLAQMCPVSSALHREPICCEYQSRFGGRLPVPRAEAALPYWVPQSLRPRKQVGNLNQGFFIWVLGELQGTSHPSESSSDSHNQGNMNNIFKFMGDSLWFFKIRFLPWLVLLSG